MDYSDRPLDSGNTMKKAPRQINLHVPEEQRTEIVRAYRTISAYATEQGEGIGEYLGRMILREASRIQRKKEK